VADYTVDALVTKMRRAGKLPPHDPTGTSDNLLAKLNDVQRLYLTHLVQSTREQYRQAYLDVTTTTGLKRYALPARAVAAGVIQVAKLNTDGSRMPLTVFSDFRVNETNYPTPGDYYLEGNELVLFNDPGSNTLRVTYERRFSELVLLTSARAITNINTGTKQVTIAAAPSAFTGQTTMDLVKGTPHFDTYGIDLACTSIGGGATTVTFSATLPTSLALGDYVCMPGETPVCNAPWELHDLLAHQSAYVWLLERGDGRAALLNKVLRGEDGMSGRGSMEGDALALLTPRVETNSKPVINQYSPGWWRGRWPFRRWPTS
jgi:hypothetical protein